MAHKGKEKATRFIRLAKIVGWIDESQILSKVLSVIYLFRQEGSNFPANCGNITTGKR